MAQMIVGKRPEEVRDEIAKWLNWHATRQHGEAGSSENPTEDQDAHAYAAALLEKLSAELRTIPCVF